MHDLRSFFHIMPFHKSENCFRFVKAIFIQNIVATMFCDHCASLKKTCVTMNSHSKCAKCICRDRFYVSIFLKSLNRIHEELKYQLDQVEAKHEIQLTMLFYLAAKVSRLRKMLKKNKTRTAQKIRCVAAELNSDNDDVSEEFSTEMSLFQFVNDFFFDFWQSFDEISSTSTAHF